MAKQMSTVRRISGKHLLSLDAIARSNLLEEGPAVLEHLGDDWAALTDERSDWLDKERFFRMWFE